MRGKVDKLELLFLKDPEIHLLKHSGAASVITFRVMLFAGLVEFFIVDFWRVSEQHVQAPGVVTVIFRLVLRLEYHVLVSEVVSPVLNAAFLNLL